MSILLRIRQIRQKFQLTSKEFAASLNVDSSQYSKIEQGKLKPTLNIIMEINSIYGISLDWLLTGKGEMILPSKVKQYKPYDESEVVNIVSESETSYKSSVNEYLRTENLRMESEIARLNQEIGKLFALLGIKENDIKELKDKLQRANEILNQIYDKKRES